MTSLSPNEEDLLRRVVRKPDLRPLFFRKVKGVKWFDELSLLGFFDPTTIPAPEPAEDEGYVRIGYWPVLDYLFKTAPELAESPQHAPKLLAIITAASRYAKDRGFGNYHVWWQFSKIIKYIPPDLISEPDLQVMDYWLADKYDRGLVALELGTNWLPILLASKDEHSRKLAIQLLELLYRVNFHDKQYASTSTREASFRFNYYYAEKITTKVAALCGSGLRQIGADFFSYKLKSILSELQSDEWSAVWHPAIEPHKQNKYRNDPENVLVVAHRDAVGSFVRTSPNEAYAYVSDMLFDEYETIRRIALHTISNNFQIFVGLLDQALTDTFLKSNYQHEMWTLLNQHYSKFDLRQKEKVLNLIAQLERRNESGEILVAATAYLKGTWLSAIRTSGEREATLYAENVATAKAEPKHPDFSSYMAVGAVSKESAVPLEKLRALPVEELVRTLQDFVETNNWEEAGIEELSRAFKQTLKSAPDKYYSRIGEFIELDLAYVCEVVEAFRELWEEKTQLPWDDIWPYLFDFCSKVIDRDEFWSPAAIREREPFVGNRNWFISGVGRLIEAGTKSDEHAFNEKYLGDAEAILAIVLAKEEGVEFDVGSDAVSKAINSPRGRCLEALINLALRSCRLADAKASSHSDAWLHFRPYFDAEMDRPDLEHPEYEFATLVTNYLPNFLYLSTEWVVANLARIFDQTQYLKWLCSMQGYRYVNIVYEEVYRHLSNHRDLQKALDDENIRERLAERVVQNIAIAFINDFERLDDERGLMRWLLLRNSREEIVHLVWFIWTLRSEDVPKLRDKVYELWPRILAQIDLKSRDGRRLASDLCQWTRFVGRLEEPATDWLLSIAPFADEAYNSSELLENLARLSEAQPFEACSVWKRMLERSAADFPEEAVRKLFQSIVSQGPQGHLVASEIESEYLKRGNSAVSQWLREIATELSAT